MFKNRFEHLRDSALWWYDKSSDLHASAGVLWLSMDDKYKNEFIEKLELRKGFDLGVCFKNYCLLFGLSFEVLLKAIISVKGFSNIPATHDLKKLYTLSMIKLDSEEVNVLDALSGYIVWAGKYQVPKNESEFNKFHEKVENVFFDKVKFNNSYLYRQNNKLEWDYLNKLWKKCSEVFFQLYQC